MTYQEASDYKEKYKNVSDQNSPLPRFHYKIKYIVILPKKCNEDERKKILDVVYSGKGNEGALKELGLFYENMDLYIVASTNEYHDMLLQHYLSETGQEI